MDGKGYEKLMTFIIALYIAKKKRKKKTQSVVLIVHCVHPHRRGEYLGLLDIKFAKIFIRKYSSRIFIVMFFTILVKNITIMLQTKPLNYHKV